MLIERRNSMDIFCKMGEILINFIQMNLKQVIQ